MGETDQRAKVEVVSRDSMKSRSWQEGQHRHETRTESLINGRMMRTSAFYHIPYCVINHYKEVLVLR